jgi:hypothetical protein
MKRMGFAFAALAVALAAPAAAAPVTVAVVDFDYLDTSGEPRNQQAEHEARLAQFVRSMRDDIAASGDFRIVSLACDRPPCTAGDTPPAELIARAKQAGARLMLFGEIHKMSTLVEWANTEIVDLAADKLVESKLFTFRGDTDEAWRRAEKFIVREMRDVAGKL